MKTRKLNIRKMEESAERLGLTQSKLAGIIGVSRETVSQWMKGDKSPRPDKLLKLAMALGLSFNDIVLTPPSANEPIVAFRKKGSHKITDQYLDEARDTGRVLANLVPYLPFDQFVKPRTLLRPRNEYSYIQAVAAKIRKQIDKAPEETIAFQDLINFFNKLNAVIIPVLWGSKDKHENALHIYLPESMTTWIYLNLDCHIHDFKFWMAHELGHVKSPDLKGDAAEDFADSFAGALLVDRETAKNEYMQLRLLKAVPKQITRIKQIAKELVVSPITVYFEVNKYAKHMNEPAIHLENIFKATTVFNKQFQTVSEYFFDDRKPTATEYMSCAKREFQSPFFDALISFLKDNKKSAGFVQTLLNLSLADAQYLYEEIC